MYADLSNGAIASVVVAVGGGGGFRLEYANAAAPGVRWREDSTSGRYLTGKSI